MDAHKHKGRRSGRKETGYFPASRILKVNYDQKI
jgi:hypothetical protein